MPEIASLIVKYQHKGMVVDTNILLLFFVGWTNRDRIERFKRTAQFTPEDYDTLIQLLNYFTKIVLTPHILTEVNSLVNQLGEPERSQCFTMISQLILQFEKRFEERYIPSQDIVIQPHFAQFGLTDGAILEVARNQHLVLTDDLKLAVHLQSQGIDSLNFNHIRTLAW
jgi:rRNA-processing protein FCF1